MTPKDVHVLIPRTCRGTWLHSKRELRLQMELKLLITGFKFGDSPGLSKWVYCSHQGPSSRRRQKRRSEQCDVRRIWPAVVSFGDGGRDRSQGIQVVSGSQKRQGNGLTSALLHLPEPRHRAASDLPQLGPSSPHAHLHPRRLGLQLSFFLLNT